MSNIPEIIEKQKKLLWNAELPSAKCIHLEVLLEMQIKDKCVGPIVSEWSDQSAKKNQLAHENTAKSVAWIRERFNMLKQSKWANHPIVEKNLRLAEAMLFCKESTCNSNNLTDYNHAIKFATGSKYPLNGFVGPALNVLDAVALIVADFGEDEIFKGWTEIEIIERETKLSQLLPGILSEQVEGMSLSEICSYSGCGFIKFKLENSNENILDPLVSYSQMWLIRLILPPYVESCLSGFIPEALSSWTEARDTDPVILYQYLKMLSEYKYYRDLILDSKESPKTWEEHELLAVRLSLKKFFRLFSSLAPKQHIVSSSKINSLVDLFFNMIEIQLLKQQNNKRKGRPNKAATKSFIQSEIKNYLFSLGKKIDVKKLKSNKKMYEDIRHSAEKHRKDCLLDLTQPLVENIYRVVLEKNGIQRGGGAPKKEKSSKKPSSNS